MQKPEHLQFLIERFDHYYDSINNKGNLFLGIGTFSTGGLFAALAVLPNYLKTECGAVFCIVVMIALNIAALIFTLWALMPYVKTCGNSLVYFGDISRMDLATFQQMFTSQTEAEVNTDLTSQVYYLSKGLGKKFYRLSIASSFFFAEAAVLIPLMIIVTLNLK